MGKFRADRARDKQRKRLACGINRPADPSGEPQIPPGWRCFDCDFYTTDKAAALAHFGERDDAEEFRPICRWWSNMDEGERRAQFQALIQELNGERDATPEPGWKHAGEGGNVTITVTRADWNSLLLTLGYAGQFIRSTDGAARFYGHLALLNRVNQGNPNWTPYAIPEEHRNG